MIFEHPSWVQLNSITKINPKSVITKLVKIGLCNHKRGLKKCDYKPKHMSPGAENKENGPACEAASIPHSKRSF